MAEHLETFLARAEKRSGLPRFVERELRRSLKCGIPAHGFLRVRCGDCGHDRIVAFSCKGRGFCPSCGGRRMADGAAHLVDCVLSVVPMRQRVLSLPFSLARDHRLMTAVLRVVMAAILGFQRQRAFRRLGVRGRCGAVAAVQRFGSALNVNVHFHAIVLDGVHVMGEGGRLRFQALPHPSALERREWTEEIAARATRLLRRRGRLSEDGALARSAELRTHEGRGVAGFDLDIGPVLRARDRGGLERRWRCDQRRRGLHGRTRAKGVRRGCLGVLALRLELGAGERVITEGDAPAGMHIVASGNVRIVHRLGAPDEAELARLACRRLNALQATR